MKLLIIYDRSVVFQQMKMSPIGELPTNENQTRYLAQLDSDLLHVRGCKNCNPFLDSVIFRLLKIELSFYKKEIEKQQLQEQEKLKEQENIKAKQKSLIEELESLEGRFFVSKRKKEILKELQSINNI